MLPFDPPPSNFAKPKFKDRTQTLEARVVKEVCAVQPTPAACQKLVEQEHFRQTGEKGSSTFALKKAGFPPPVLAAVVNISTPAQFLNKFGTSALYQFWLEGVRFEWWEGVESRAVAFNWVGWGVCVLHAADWLETTAGQLILPDPESPEYYLRIEPISAWARAHSWNP